MAANNEDFEDDVEQNEQELEQIDEDKRKRYFSKERKFDRRGSFIDRFCIT